MTPLRSTSPLGRQVGVVLSGAFVGFIWGWYQVPDHPNSMGVSEFAAFAWPLGGGCFSLAVYSFCRNPLFHDDASRSMLTRVFATAAVCTYYWFRLPALVGFGPHFGTGVLVDLAHILPIWTPVVSRIVSSSFFIWFLLIRPYPNAAWMVRPHASSVSAPT